MVGVPIPTPNPPLADLSHVDLMHGDCVAVENVFVVNSFGPTLLVVTPESVPRLLAAPYTMSLRAEDDVLSHPERACP